MKKLFIFFICLFSVSCFASTNSSIVSRAILGNCAHAVPTSNPQFCPSFKSVAGCHCRDAHGSPAACNDMTWIYNAMISMYHSLEGACTAQHDTSTQECIDDWNFYRSHC